LPLLFGLSKNNHFYHAVMALPCAVLLQAIGFLIDQQDALEFEK
jgi:hypothetical protein